jgi:hypothetical protein
MAVHPPKPRRSPKQVQAGQKWAAAGRRKQHQVRMETISRTGQPPPRSPKQQVASHRWARAGQKASQAAAAARRAGKAPTPKKKARAELNPQVLLDLIRQDPRKTAVSLDLPARTDPLGLTPGYPPGYAGSVDQLYDPPDLDFYPACAAAAVAEHLAKFTGIIVPDASVLRLNEIVQTPPLSDLLEYLKAEGFPGTGIRLSHFEPCGPDYDVVDGLLYGVQLPRSGYHAVLAVPGGMISWGRLLPLHGTPEEAWWLEWEAE